MKTKGSPWQYLKLQQTSQATKAGDSINIHMMTHHFRHGYIILCTVTPLYAQLHHSMHSYTTLCTATPLYAQLHHFMQLHHFYAVTPLYAQIHHFMHSYTTLYAVTDNSTTTSYTHIYIYVSPTIISMILVALVYIICILMQYG